ncbi:MAG TPA: TSUP family transporter [Aquella sp.]|nr:TSUP family transporter [Aquella sp.]
MITIFFSHHYFILLSFLLFMAFLASFIDAVAGGGGLISVPALIYTGMPMAFVFGTNKFQSMCGTAMAVRSYYKAGYINFLTVYRGLIFGLIGAVSGALTVNYVSNKFMSFIVPFLMLGVFLFNLFNKKLGVKPGKKRMDEILFFSVFGFILGFYDAFFGPGTGNFWIIAIVFFLGYTFLDASGYAKVLNLKSNVFSFIIFLYYGKVNFIFGFIMIVGSLAGGILGAKFVIAKGSKVVRPFFMAVVLVNVLVSFYELFFHRFNL